MSKPCVYAREALITLAGAGIPTPERGYVGDGGPSQMIADIRRLRDERDAALGRAEAAEKQLTAARRLLATIVESEGQDAGVILLSDDAPTHYVAEVGGQVYVHEHFSPLGDALVKLAAVLSDKVTP